MTRDSRRRRTSWWPLVRSTLVFVSLFTIVLLSWLSEGSDRWLPRRLDVLLLLVFLGSIVALTLEPDSEPTPATRRARRSRLSRIGLVIGRRK